MTAADRFTGATRLFGGTTTAVRPRPRPMPTPMATDEVEEYVGRHRKPGATRMWGGLQRMLYVGRHGR